MTDHIVEAEIPPDAVVADALAPQDGAVVERARVPKARSPMASWLPGHRSARRQEHLIESLNEVADAISSTKSIPEILSTVVDETKRLIDTDKAVLCLFNDSGSELTINPGSHRFMPYHMALLAILGALAGSAIENSRQPAVIAIGRTFGLTP
jgi:hypothetical protein